MIITERLEQLPVTIWIGAITVLIAVIIITFIINKKRNQEVDELQKAFGDPYDYPEEDEGTLGKGKSKNRSTERVSKQPQRPSTFRQHASTTEARSSEEHTSDWSSDTEKESDPEFISKQDNDQGETQKEAGDENEQASYAASSLPSRGNRHSRKAK